MNSLRRLAIGLLCATVLTDAATVAANAQDMLDTSKLPRVQGSKDIFANPATTIFSTSGTVAQTSDAVASALKAAGWQRYAPAFATQMQTPTMSITTWKKGAIGLNVMTNVAPAQGNVTTVNYTGNALAHDLPFPPDATDISFDPNRPYLTCMTAPPIDASLAWFRKELGARGFSPWTVKDGTKAGDSAFQKSDKGAYGYFANDSKLTLVLTLKRSDDGSTTRVELKNVPPEDLAPAPPPVAAAPPAPPPAPRRTATDDAVDDMMKQAQQVMRDAMADATRPPGKPPVVVAQAPAGSGDPLQPMASSPAPIPIPNGAEDVDFNGDDGKLEFSSAASVQSLAAFYRGAMKSLGWKQDTSVINRVNMAQLDFTKGGKDISLTIMQMGAKVTVSGDGSGLQTADAKSGGSDSAQSGKAPVQASADDLAVEESGGLPVPKRHTMAGSESTPFRTGMTASVPLELTDVLGFYRKELSKRGWKEDSASSVVKADQAALTYTSPSGPAVLKLGRKDDETTVSLALRKTDDAAKAGMLPKPGQSKILFGNMTGADATVTINKQTVKVGAGVGSKGPNGPTLDLPPGKYTYSFRLSGKPPQNDDVEVGADETWGLLVGPGGVLALQAY